MTQFSYASTQRPPHKLFPLGDLTLSARDLDYGRRVLSPISLLSFLSISLSLALMLSPGQTRPKLQCVGFRSPGFAYSSRISPLDSSPNSNTTSTYYYSRSDQTFKCFKEPLFKILLLVPREPLPQPEKALGIIRLGHSPSVHGLIIPRLFSCIPN